MTIYGGKGFGASADNRLDVTKMFLSYTVKKIWGKKGNAGYLHFLTMFSKGFFPRVVKTLNCVVKNLLIARNFPCFTYLTLLQTSTRI